MFVPPFREDESITAGPVFPLEIIMSMSWGLIRGRSAGITSVASAFILTLYSVASIIAWFIPRGLSSSSRVVFLETMFSIFLSDVTMIMRLTFFEEFTAEITSVSMAVTKRFLRLSDISFTRRDLDSATPLKGIITWTLKFFPQDILRIGLQFNKLFKKFSLSLFVRLSQLQARAFQQIEGYRGYI